MLASLILEVVVLEKSCRVRYSSSAFSDDKDDAKEALIGEGAQLLMS